MNYDEIRFVIKNVVEMLADRKTDDISTLALMTFIRHEIFKETSEHLANCRLWR